MVQVLLSLERDFFELGYVTVVFFIATSEVMATVAIAYEIKVVGSGGMHRSLKGGFPRIRDGPGGRPG